VNEDVLAFICCDEAITLLCVEPFNLACCHSLILTVIGLLNPPVYSTEILVNREDHVFDDTYQVTLADETYGNVKIIYIDSVEDYFVHADLKKVGKTVLVLESPSGEKKEFDLSIEKDRYEITQK
jgi:hypothetical protein